MTKHEMAASTALRPDERSAIARVLAGAGERISGPVQAELIPGGRSNLTFLLTEGSSKWILRTPPRAGRTPSAHDVAREHRVVSALAGTQVPVPRAVALCEDESLIGGPFAVTAFVEGRTVRSRADLDGLDDHTLASVVDQLVSTLATLHRVDHVDAGLASYGRPDAYAERQLRRWSGQWDLVGTDEHRSAAAELVAKLSRLIPTQRSTGIVHGDYRIDNTRLDLAGEAPRVAAVVDWELSTIGDPIADVAMMCAYRHPALDLVLGSPSAWTSPRLPDVSSLAAAYESAGGAPLDSWAFHLALAYLKIGVIAAGIDHRARAGSGLRSGIDTAGESVGSYFDVGLDALRSRT